MTLGQAALILVALLVGACSRQQNQDVALDSRVVVQVGATSYAFPRTFLGQADDPKNARIVALHVHYPDLSPVGYASGRCPPKIALTGLACPYFSIFLVPSDSLPKGSGMLPERATPVRDDGNLKLFEWGSSDWYQWKEKDGLHLGFCMRPQEP